MIKIDNDLMLRLLKEEDVQTLFDIIDSEREHLRQWLPFVDMTRKVEDTRNGLKSVATPENPQFCIIYQGKVVGLIGLKETERLNQKTEIGYWMSQRCEGKGTMTKSVIKLLEYIFGVMKMNKVTIKVAVGNSKSRNIPKRIGFVEEGIERESELLVDGFFADIVVYSMLRKEYLRKIENGDIKISAPEQLG